MRDALSSFFSLFVGQIGWFFLQLATQSNEIQLP